MTPRAAPSCPASPQHEFSTGSPITYQPQGYGIASLAGFGQAAFKQQSNDLVVPTDSALGKHQHNGPTGLIVNCDHFSFLTQEPVKQAIQAAVDRP